MPQTHEHRARMMFAASGGEGWERGKETGWGAQPRSLTDKKSGSASNKIIYTYTDEAPMLATHAFYPIVKAFVSKAGVAMEMKDISVAARLISQFPEFLKEEQRMPDDLTALLLLK